MGVGTHWPPAPPELSDQCEVSNQSPELPTQYSFLPCSSEMLQPLMFPMPSELHKAGLPGPTSSTSWMMKRSNWRSWGVDR